MDGRIIIRRNLRVSISGCIGASWIYGGHRGTLNALKEWHPRKLDCSRRAILATRTSGGVFGGHR